MTGTAAIAGRPGEPRSRTLIKHLLAHLARLRHQRWRSLDFPEERIRSRAAVQVIAMEDTGRTTAIEHVPLDVLGARDEASRQFLAAFEPLEREPALRLPGFHVDVAVGPGEASTRVDWKLLAGGVRGWCSRRAAVAPEGVSAHVVTVSGRVAHLHVEKVRCPGETGRLSIALVAPPADFASAFQARLQRHLGPLVSASADRHTVLFEKAVGLWNLGHLRTELEASVDFPDLGRLHEIWFVDTRDVRPEDDLAFRLVMQNPID